MAEAVRTINVNDVIDSRPLSRFQYLTFTLCVLVGAIDGFDSNPLLSSRRFLANDLGSISAASAQSLPRGISARSSAP